MRKLLFAVLMLSVSSAYAGNIIVQSGAGTITGVTAGTGMSGGGTTGTVTLNNTGVLSISSTSTGGTPITGAAQLLPGSNVTLTQSGQGITIASTGGGGSVSVSTGLAAGWSGPATVSAASAVNFSSYTFNTQLTGSATAFVSLIYNGFNQAVGSTTQTMNGTDIVMSSITNVPPLAAGACYMMTGAIGAQTTATTSKIFFDNVQVSSPTLVSNGLGGYYITWHQQYCNNQGSQSTQELIYDAPQMYITYAAFNTGAGATPSLSQYYNDGPYSVPPAIDWTKSHTVYVKFNAASGAATLAYFTIHG